MFRNFCPNFFVRAYDLACIFTTVCGARRTTVVLGRRVAAGRHAAGAPGSSSRTFRGTPEWSARRLARQRQAQRPASPPRAPFPTRGHVRCSQPQLVPHHLPLLGGLADVRGDLGLVPLQVALLALERADGPLELLLVDLELLLGGELRRRVAHGGRGSWPLARVPPAAPQFWSRPVGRANGAGELRSGIAQHSRGLWLVGLKASMSAQVSVPLLTGGDGEQLWPASPRCPCLGAPAPGGCGAWLPPLPVAPRNLPRSRCPCGRVAPQVPAKAATTPAARPRTSWAPCERHARLGRRHTGCSHQHRTSRGLECNMLLRAAPRLGSAGDLPPTGLSCPPPAPGRAPLAASA